jgi:hypothetical protein
MDSAMNTANLTLGNLRREDILVSICLSDVPATAAAFAAIRDIAKRLDARFRFREIILVVDDEAQDKYLSLVEQIADLRLLTVRAGNTYYDRRVIAAEEAIGDVVLIGNCDEFPHVNAVKMLEQADEQNSIVLATRSQRVSMRSGLSAPIIALGRAAGFKVNLNDLQTIVLPRALLNHILLHSDPELALRFPPRDHRLQLSFFAVESEIPFQSGIHQLRRRLQLLQKLLVHMAPGLLMLVALTSTVLALIGVIYTFYVIGVWFFLENLAPGWLTTSVMLSLSATFMGFSMLGLSLGLQQVLNQMGKKKFDNIASEINRIDLFSKVRSDLNIDLDKEISQSIKDKV